MTAIAAATSALGAYQREAGRFAASTPRVGGKVITSDVGVSLGPFAVRYSATDYEFDLSGIASQQQSFADALDAAATTQQLADTPALTPSTPNALTRRQALQSYNETATLRTPSPSLFRATV